MQNSFRFISNIQEDYIKNFNLLRPCNSEVFSDALSLPLLQKNKKLIT